MPRGKPSATLVPPEAEKPPRIWIVEFLARFERFGRDFAGLVLITVVLMTLVGLLLPAWTGGLLEWWNRLLKLWLGWGSVWIVVGCGMFGAWLFRRPMDMERTGSAFWKRLFTLEAAAFSSLALLAVSGGLDLERAEAGLDGGRIGWGLATILRMILEPLRLSSHFVLALLLSFFFLVTFTAGTGLKPWLCRWAKRISARKNVKTDGLVELEQIVSEAPLQAPDPTAPSHRKIALPVQFRKNFRIEPEEPANIEIPSRDELLPPLDILVNDQMNKPDERNINLTAGLIEKTLSEFGIPAKVVGFQVGPTVTQFAVEPGYLEKEKNGESQAAKQKVRVAQIAGLSRDLSLALAAAPLRIEAPVPGRPYVGIEVPNARSTIVRLRPLMESEAFRRIKSPLAIALGQDVSGQPFVADLARMPHLLIAGTTGSGKSVCIAALTTCLVVNNSPEDLRLVMIDPKMVELVRFNGLPHLYGKVETELERILGVLRWTVAEMDRRYKALEASRSRNLDSHNRKIRRRKGEQPIPHIVVMIDELADLMMSAPDQTEHHLVRLAQMARATGIHLVVATQRPGTDVVTGLIKANFPARIAFTVASSVDSRVILDVNGAETLLGHGDMLFLPPEAPGPIRLQGVMVSDTEVEKAILFWQKSWAGSDQGQTEGPPWEETIAQVMTLTERDNLIDQAVEIIKKGQRASASLLQRRLHIGYPRAARLIDELEEMGIIGPALSGGREREVLIEKEDNRDDEI